MLCMKMIPPLGSEGGDGQMLSDGVGGGVGELFPQDLYSEKIRTCVYLSYIYIYTYPEGFAQPPR